ncbi:peroxiredoxin-like family protein [Niabella beijingensis]|uniref:peroxiredoxin-like family protein n=1 Tax=Niabella beijingensis TaxID=2872700 RepID=UPI001CBE0287|nr:peroxiredoxin-like family protein [Niabella beijingensis]MBZ4192527.1 AhpC/TSA family protein [Niabella beijingensis]
MQSSVLFSTVAVFEQRDVSNGRSIVRRWAGLLLLLLLAALQFSTAAQQRRDSITADHPPAFPEDISPLLTGESIPRVTLPDKEGKLFDLNKAVTAQPVVLIFYRGGWCPFCNRQLAGLQAVNGDLVKKGFQVIAIGTDSPELLKRSSEKEKLDYLLLSDAGVTTARKFGIAYKAPEQYAGILQKSTGGKNKDLLLPVPAVFILDRKGVIRFEYINPDFKQRISVPLLLAAANALYAEL